MFRVILIYSFINDDSCHASEDLQKCLKPTAKANMRDVLPTCQDTSGQVGWNRLRSRCKLKTKVILDKQIITWFKGKC